MTVSLLLAGEFFALLKKANGNEWELIGINGASWTFCEFMGLNGN